MPAGDFAHTVEPPDLTAWATRRYAVPLFLSWHQGALPTLRAVLRPQHHRMHDAPGQQRKRPGDYQRSDEQGHHGVAMLANSMTVRMPDRDRQHRQGEYGQQVDGAPRPPQPDLMNEKGAHAHHDHEGDPDPADRPVRQRSLRGGELNHPQGKRRYRGEGVKLDGRRGGKQWREGHGFLLPLAPRECGGAEFPGFVRHVKFCKRGVGGWCGCAVEPCSTQSLRTCDGSIGAGSIRRQKRDCLDAVIPFLHPASDIMVPPFDSEPSMKVFILRAVALLALAVLPGCTSDSGTPPQPSFYTSLANDGATVDATAAASMISGYRGNNGLGAVEVDADLMRMAMDHARVMAAK